MVGQVASPTMLALQTPTSAALFDLLPKCSDVAKLTPQTSPQTQHHSKCTPVSQRAKWTGETLTLASDPQLTLGPLTNSLPAPLSLPGPDP